MAKATTYKFSEFAIKVGDGNSPEVFAAICGLTSRGFNRTANTNETVTPDCADEDAPAWVERDVNSLSWELSGEGVMAAEAIADWDAFFGNQKNVQISLGENTWEGAAILTGFNITGQRGSRVTCSVTLQGTGEIPALA